MSRLRTIKPEFWSNPSVLCRLIEARLLFIGMWNFCDDQGNIEASPFQIKCLVFPAENINIEPLLKDLEELKKIPGTDLKERLIIKYKVDGKEYYHIPGFIKHQRIDHPSKPRCPAYSPELAVMPQVQDGELFNQPSNEPPPSNKSGLSENAFRLFWEQYPNKAGKKRAILHFKAQIKTVKNFKNLELALKNYLKHLARKENNWKTPQNGDTFVNNHTDWIDFKEPSSSKSNTGKLKAIEEAHAKQSKR